MSGGTVVRATFPDVVAVGLAWNPDLADVLAPSGIGVITAVTVGGQGRGG